MLPDQAVHPVATAGRLGDQVVVEQLVEALPRRLRADVVERRGGGFTIVEPPVVGCDPAVEGLGHRLDPAADTEIADAHFPQAAVHVDEHGVEQRLGGIRRPRPALAQAAQDEEDKALITYDIQVIGSSQFGKTREGKEIVVLLNRLHRNGNIAYGNTSEDDGRGFCDGQNITVNGDFRENLCSTSATLVHEGSHALWRKKHPKPDGKDKSKLFKDAVEDELHAQENELVIYTWLKNNKGCSDDFVLETRLKRNNNGTLRSVIEESFSAIVNSP